MERTYINEAQKAIGGTVKVQGFIENLRNSKYMAFIVLKDITGKLQITVEKEDHPDLVDTIDKLTPDSVITVTGKVMENDYVKMGGVEMIPESIEIESIADALPIVRKEIAATKKKKAVERSSIDQRIDYRWIDLRTDENQLMFKAQSCFVNAMRKFLLDRNFIEIHTPKLIAAASESGSEVFKVDYFDRNAYLAQSPQFYKQMAMAAGFERIFETGPVFRAEKSYTNKHSTEFSGFDLEFSYITSYKDVMKMEEELQTSSQQLLFHLHHVFIGSDVAELQIEAGELGGVLVGVALLCAEHGAGLEDALKAGSHGHLLVELGALCQIGIAVEVIHLEHLRAALAGSSDQLGGVDLDEVTVQQELAHGVDEAALCLEHQLVLVGAQVDPAVVDALVDAGALHSLLFLGGCNLLADDGQCIGNTLDLDALGDHLHAAHLDVVVLHHLAGDGDDGIRGELIDGIHQIGVIFLFHRDLQFTGNILQHDKGHIFAVAQVLDKALHLDRAADGLLGLVDIGAFHNTGILL